MATGKEIITLQIGHYSNFIGAHWWNIQEQGFDYAGENVSEINHDVLFREGLTDKGYVTYTPRMVLVDLKGSLVHLPERGELYEDVSAPDPTSAIWSEDKVDVIQAPKKEKNEFLQDLSKDYLESEEEGDIVYNLDNEVNVWSDFLRTRYHPRSTSIINEYNHGNSMQKFDVFNYGVNTWKKASFEETFTDNIRNLVEECDNMQGFHIITDCTDGFAGICSSALEHLQDEYSSKNTLIFPAIMADFPGSTPLQDTIRTVNTVLAFSKLSELGSLIVPLSIGTTGWRNPGPPRKLPMLAYNAELPYHTSAILAVALETVSLPYRMKSSSATHLSDICQGLSQLGRKFAAASVSLPFCMKDDAFLLDTLENWEGPLWESLTPNCSLQEERIWLQSVVLRGIPQSKLKSPKEDVRSPAYSCGSIQEMLSLFLSCCSYATVSQVSTIEKPVPVTPPYPQFFAPTIGKTGFISPNEQQKVKRVSNVPVLSGLHSSNSVGTMLESLHLEASKLRLQRLHQFQNSGLEEDEFKECMNHLLERRECYNEEFDV